MSRLSREQRIEILGHDPAEMTEERYLEAQRTTLRRWD